MEFPYDVLTLSAALVALSAIAWLELRYIKKRRVDTEATVEEDHVYNSLATYKAVSDSLRARGRDTTEADVLLFQAESAYRRGQYTDCKDLSDRAKIALRNAPDRVISGPPAPSPASSSEAGGIVDAPFPAPVITPTDEAMPAEVPSIKTRKMPCNYLESKFIIESTRSMLEKAPEMRRETARCMLDDAEACFEAADYTDALRHAAKAKRLLEGCEEAAPAEKAPDGHEEKERSAVTCTGCGAAMSEEDAFCFACGAPARRSCPGCSAEIVEGDAFCRRCGTRL